MDSSDSDFSTVEKTGGQKEKKLEYKNMPMRVAITAQVANANSFMSGIKWGAISVNKLDYILTNLYDLKANGENWEYDVPISLLQPYVVTYMWKRVS